MHEMSADALHGDGAQPRLNEGAKIHGPTSEHGEMLRVDLLIRVRQKRQSNPRQYRTFTAGLAIAAVISIGVAITPLQRTLREQTVFHANGRMRLARTHRIQSGVIQPRHNTTLRASYRHLLTAVHSHPLSRIAQRTQPIMPVRQLSTTVHNRAEAFRPAPHLHASMFKVSNNARTAPRVAMHYSKQRSNRQKALVASPRTRAPVAVRMPHLILFQVMPSSIAAGFGATLCLRASDATEIFVTHLGELRPGQTNCRHLVPQTTTTYTAWIVGERGHAIQRSLVLTVKNS